MTKNYAVSNEKFDRARSLIMTNGGSISDENRFEVFGVKGHFVRNGGTISITVTKKPMLARWSVIEAKLDEFFG